MKESVLIVGSMAFDDLEMPYGTFHDVLGGAATYAAIAASSFAPVRVVGVVGDDFPGPVLQQLEARGVDIAGVERAPGKTFRWHGRYAHDLGSRETIHTALNVFADFRPKIPSTYATSPYLLLGNIHPALQLDVLAQVERPKLVVADTMNLWIHTERKTLGELLRKVDVLSINDEEAKDLTGHGMLRKAADEIRALGPKRVIIKKGEHGAAIFDDEGVFFVPAYPLEVLRDPTGAGDSFAGALLGVLAGLGRTDGAAIRQAMIVASTVASFGVEGLGPERLLSLDRPALAERLQAFESMMNYGGPLPALP